MPSSTSRGAPSATPKAPASIGITEYMTRRKAIRLGDAFDAADSRPAHHPDRLLSGNTVVERFSDDLERGLRFRAYDLPRTDDDIVDGENMYIVNTENRDTETITKQVAVRKKTRGLRRQARVLRPKMFRAGASADMHLVTFTSTDAAAAGNRTRWSFYEWEEGGTPAPRQLPARTVSRPKGLKIPERRIHQQRNRLSGRLARHLMAARKAPSSSTSDATTPTRSGSPNRRGSDKSIPKASKFEYITLDSKHIFFSTTSPLLDGDVNGETDIYMYTDTPDPENGIESDPDLLG